jgi:hypothetical protein
MSDFLTRLAARAVGTAPVVQPRLPSLFEAGGQGYRPVVEVDVQRETPAIDQNNRTVSAEVKQSGRISQLPQRVPFGEARPAIKTEIDHRPQQPVITTTPVTKPKTEPAQPSTFSSELTESSQPTIEATGRAASPHVVEDVRATKSEQITVPDREHESEWPLIQPKVRQLISDRLSESSTRQPRDENSAPTSIPIAAPVQSPQIRPAEVLVREPSVISEAPAPINVTIGRVDVRAVFAPVAQPMRATKDVHSQTASLDEYLKKRSGVNR